MLTPPTFRKSIGKLKWKLERIFTKGAPHKSIVMASMINGLPPVKGMMDDENDRFYIWDNRERKFSFAKEGRGHCCAWELLDNEARERGDKLEIPYEVLEKDALSQEKYRAIVRKHATEYSKRRDPHAFKMGLSPSVNTSIFNANDQFYFCNRCRELVHPIFYDHKLSLPEAKHRIAYCRQWFTQQSRARDDVESTTFQLGYDTQAKIPGAEPFRSLDAEIQVPCAAESEDSSVEIFLRKVGKRLVRDPMPEGPTATELQEIRCTCSQLFKGLVARFHGRYPAHGEPGPSNWEQQRLDELDKDYHEMKLIMRAILPVSDWVLLDGNLQLWLEKQKPRRKWYSERVVVDGEEQRRSQAEYYDSDWSTDEEQVVTDVEQCSRSEDLEMTRDY